MAATLSRGRSVKDKYKNSCKASKLIALPLTTKKGEFNGKRNKKIGENVFVWIKQFGVFLNFDYM